MERLNAEDYFREALAVLGQHGSDAMTIAVLCERLDVTKGSFYHHFGSMPGFVDQLLAWWEREHSDRLIAISRAQPDPAMRIFLLTDMGANLPHGPEAAFRVWARSNPNVAEVVARVDKRRERHLVDSISALGIERGRARLFTRIALSVLIGAQQRELPVDVRRLRQMFEEINRMIFLEADASLVEQVLEAQLR